MSVSFHSLNRVQFSKKDRAKLLSNAGIIRNRMKIDAAITNAKAVVTIQNGSEFDSFGEYIWGFALKSRPKRKSGCAAPVKSAEAELMSKDLKKRGFRFVGPTICYAFMQMVGIVNDHIEGCWKCN